MKRIFIITTLFTILLSNGYSQNSSSKDFAYLFSDSTIYGSSVQLKSPLLATPYLKIDDIKISLPDVKFYSNLYGYHANTKNVSFSGASKFAKRISQGEINLYERKIKTTSMSMNPATGMSSYGSTYTRYKYYFNTGTEDIKKVNYADLSQIMSGDAVSMGFLEKYKNLNNTATVFGVVGCAAIIGGMAALINKDANSDPMSMESPDITAELIIAGSGMVCCWVSYFVSLGKPKRIKKVFDAYNDNLP
ncbi:hypothetical protein OAO55_01555 [Bacteroidales bacterium]|nr:hypothetical protein [Bacteroidales bacterium]